MFSFVILISSLLVFLLGWLLLLDGSNTQPMRIVTGMLGIVAGLLNIRRIRVEERDQR